MFADGALTMLFCPGVRVSALSMPSRLRSLRNRQTGTLSPLGSAATESRLGTLKTLLCLERAANQVAFSARLLFCGLRARHGHVSEGRAGGGARSLPSDDQPSMAAHEQDDIDAKLVRVRQMQQNMHIDILV